VGVGGLFDKNLEHNHFNLKTLFPCNDHKGLPVAAQTLVDREVYSPIHLYNFTFLIVKLHQHWLNCILSTEELLNT
jgi:hypothetical protein